MCFLSVTNSDLFVFALELSPPPATENLKRAEAQLMRLPTKYMWFATAEKSKSISASPNNCGWELML